MAQMRGPTPVPKPPGEAGDPVAGLEHSLHRAGALLSDERARELSDILARWKRRRFAVLIVGEFKRGKSTLLNALVGEDLLPTGVEPVTAVPTGVRSGPRRRARARFRDGTERDVPLDEVRDYVDETRNPGNRRGVARMDIEIPDGPPPGVVLVDVPGLGSIHEHNTESALAALPEADAALVVASVDPPVGEAELRLLRAVSDHAARVEVVLNKVDYLGDEGRKTAEDFTRRTLGGEGLPETPVWPVSARDGLRARLAHDDVGWRRSGMGALSDHLGRFLREERTALLARSLASKAGRLVEQESALVDVQLAAAEKCSKELRGIIEAFRARRTTLERDSAEAVVIFQRRFDALFTGYAERATEAWKPRRDTLASRLRDVLASREARSRSAASKAIEAAVREAVDAFVEAFVPEEARRLAGAYGRLSAEIGRAAAEGAEAVWRLAADLLPFDPPGVDEPVPPPVPPPSVSELASLHLLLDGLADTVARLLPRRAALGRLTARAREEADTRYGRAVEQSRETFRRAYDEHFRGRLGALREAARQTARALEAALAAAEARAGDLEQGRAAAGAPEAARRAALREARERLRPLERAVSG
jgi:Dynamin family